MSIHNTHMTSPTRNVVRSIFAINKYQEMVPVVRYVHYRLDIKSPSSLGYYPLTDLTRRIVVMLSNIKWTRHNVKKIYNAMEKQTNRIHDRLVTGKTVATGIKHGKPMMTMMDAVD